MNSELNTVSSQVTAKRLSPNFDGLGGAIRTACPNLETKVAAARSEIVACAETQVSTDLAGLLADLSSFRTD